jgi:hypothetical protein
LTGKYWILTVIDRIKHISTGNDRKRTGFDRNRKMTGKNRILTFFDRR